jgi:hypothetical protein
MGRKRASLMNDVSSNDSGDPGTYFFDYPQVIDIKSKKPMTQQETEKIWTPTTPRNKAYGAGACRLVSSHQINGYVPPSGLEYHLARWPSSLDADAYLEIMRVQGFGAGAIVTRKHQPYTFMKRIPRWGVIMFECTYTSSIEWQPYYVKWFSAADEPEHAWAEDLFLIQAALDDSMVDTILEQQGCEIPEVKG